MKRFSLAITATALALVLINGPISAGGSGWFTDEGYFQISKVCRDGYQFSRASSGTAGGVGGAPYSSILARLYSSHGPFNEELQDEWFNEDGSLVSDELILESDYYPILGPTASVSSDQIIEVKNLEILGDSSDKFLAQDVSAYFFKQLEVGDQVRLYKTILPVEDCFLASINREQNGTIAKDRLDATNSGIPANDLIITVLEIPENRVSNGNNTLSIGEQLSFAEIDDSGLSYSADDNMQSEVEYFRYSIQGTIRVSVNSKGLQASGGDSSEPSISADGRKIAFTTEATNLSSPLVFDDNGVSDIILREPLANKTTFISSRSSESIGDAGRSYASEISPDGSQIIFVSAGEHLLNKEQQCETELEVDDVSDIYLYQSGSLKQFSVFRTFGEPCQQFTNDSVHPSISDTIYGQENIVFQTNEPLEFPFHTDENSADDLLFSRNSSTFNYEPIYGINELGIAPSPGVTPTLDMPNGASQQPSISADGNAIAYLSHATNLIKTFSGRDADTNGVADIYVSDWDGENWAVSRVSITSDGSQTTGGGSAEPAISRFGRHIAFSSFANNLDERANDQVQIYVRDRDAECTTLLSINKEGEAGSVASFEPSISADGRFVAFYSFAPNLIENDTNAASDIFVVDRDADGDQAFYTDPENCVAGPSRIFRVSVASDGTQANGASYDPDISDNGAFVAFTSQATNLVENDTNRHSDVFVHYVGFEGNVRFVAQDPTNNNQPVNIYLPVVVR